MSEPNQIIDELLVEQGIELHELPDLVDDPSAIEKWLSDLWDKLLDYLDFSFSGSNSDYFAKAALKAFIGFIVDYGTVILSLLLALLLIYIVVRFLMARFQRDLDVSTQSHDGVVIADLPSQIEVLLNQNKFDEAFRLRWMQFLVQTGEPHDKTPFEYMCHTNTSLSETVKGILSDSYRHMFRYTTSQLSDYKTWNDTLQNLMGKQS